MSHFLTNIQIDRLKQHFYLPALIENWLEHPEHFQVADEYRVHEILSDLQPGEALLCTSLSIETILTHYGQEHKSLQTLDQVAGQIVASYGRTEEDGHISANHQDISQIVADLQRMQNALEAGEASVPYAQDDIHNRLYSAFLIQNAAQLDIARYVVDQIDGQSSATGDLSHILAHIAESVANDNPLQR